MTKITEEMIEAGARAIAPEVWVIDPATFGHPDSLNSRGHELCKLKVRAQAEACLAAALGQGSAEGDGDILDRLRQIKAACTQKTFLHSQDWREGKKIVQDAIVEIERLRADKETFATGWESDLRVFQP